MEHVRSYYAASAHPAPLREPLRDEITADVCVVGGGIAGCSTALDLAARGYRVVLLEGRRIAWGASGRSGGQAIFGFAAGQDRLVAQVGREAAKRLFDVTVDALDLLKDRVARHAIDCDLHWGQMHVAIKPRHETELRAWQEELARDVLGERFASLYAQTRRGEMQDFRSYVSPLDYAWYLTTV